MKNRIILSTLLAGALLFSACESDRESNPTLLVPESFTLNTPALSDGVYYLDSSDKLALSCSQPEYGYTAPVIYTVELSLDDTFETMEALPTSYTTAKMSVIASEVAVAVTNLQLAAGKKDVDFPMTTPLSIRLKADLSDTDATVYSNSVDVNVNLSYSLPPVKFPENMYIVVSICEWNWDNAISMVPVYANGDGEFGGSFWSMVYLAEGSEIKVNKAAAWDGGEGGFGGATIEDNADASVSDKGGNIGVANAGWYVIVVKTEVDGVNLKFSSISFYEPNVYLYGATNGGVWEADEANLFTVPADGTGDFVSNAFVADGEIRACVVLPETDWWKSEFIVLDKKLEYRGNGPDQKRATGSVGQKLYINFSTKSGEIK